MLSDDTVVVKGVVISSSEEVDTASSTPELPGEKEK